MSLLSKAQLVKKLLTNRKFRDAYVYEHVRNGIPFQIRALRKNREWSQAELAEAANTSRTVITRIEDPNYGNLTLKTLYQIASAFDVALIVKFVPFSRLLREYDDVSPEALAAKDIASERQQLQRWASSSVRTATTSGAVASAQLQLGFAITNPMEASASELTQVVEPVVSGNKISNVVSITTRRPLRQRRRVTRTVAVRLRLSERRERAHG